MKQTLSLIEILNALPSLRVIAGQKGMRGATIYRLTKNIENVERELDAINKARAALFEKYAVETKDGREIPGNKLAEADAEFDELLRGTTTDVEIRQIGADEIAGDEITVNTLRSVMWMIKDDEVPDAPAA